MVRSIRAAANPASLLWHSISTGLIAAGPVYAFQANYSVAFFREHWFATLGTAFAYALSVLWTSGHYASRLSRLRTRLLSFSCLLGAYAFVLVIDQVSWPASILISSTATAIAFAAWSSFIPPRGVLSFSIPLVAAAAFFVPGKIVQRRIQPHGDTHLIYSRNESIRATFYRGYIPFGATPGVGFAAVGKQIFLLTGDGEFTLLDFAPDGDTLRTTPLPFKAPLNNSAFAATAMQRNGWNFLRATGFAVLPQGSNLRFLVMHHIWHSADQCATMRLSLLDRPAATLTVASSDTWRTVYETHPCLPFRAENPPAFRVRESGGRVIATDSDHVLVTVGDHEYDGVNSRPAQGQDPATDYGKTILITISSGERRLFTMGHRNPQGLFRDSQGTIWSTEHGPNGGDELNELKSNSNYGWPLVTYGTDYGEVRWPPSPTPGEHTGFAPPLFSWTPSIGISNLIVVRGAAFPGWTGDFLIAGLGDESLHRLRVRDGRVVYDERIQIGERVRDIAQVSDDQILLWTDSQAIISLRPLNADTEMTRAFAGCAACHPVVDGKTPGVGPDLFGVYRRAFGAVPGFEYSAALRDPARRWNQEALDRFLANPAGFLPGTKMDVPGITDARQRELVIAHLRSLR